MTRNGATITRSAGSVKNDNLPFISAAQVQRETGTEGSRIWVVIDDIVYDVTEFSKQHPGGQVPLRNFAGKSCSWQFHQIHSLKTLQKYEKLRVGWTEDAPNPYQKPKPQIVKPLWSHQNW
ncbi:cytochrome b5-like heme/steroid binding domain-containing protein [Aspergillus glaucus CBS 516.65]|uniref:Delta 8-(E)-sphingolipid desaturase n=1 Tax=Aspergillus glaucus CBS 516.65 TaxID=1160497 RepID=A0A1L9VH16_ASPGL|nr:hypothetical protein ASPGLDRAFT_48606 [Aspergillus glaucus CBS 516.65]OJJ83217.1 hypothetical protein ASPGLDRAFT_48606 [Aspergillus glaucus CBS 516.65]